MMASRLASVLEEIVAAHRATAAADDRSLDELLSAAAATPAPRPFAAALKGSGVAVIAEIKRRSPSKGDLAPDLVPAELAGTYERGGASALSVLTDNVNFGGSGDDLSSARGACLLPVLRKDFTVDARDVADARIMGADAILLIVAALADPELVRFGGLASELGMAAVVEVHDVEELARALDCGATVVGVNQRDLRTFVVDRHRAEKLIALIPADVIRVAESGIGGPDDVGRLSAAGYDAVLVGEHLVTAPDPGLALSRLRAG